MIRQRKAKYNFEDSQNQIDDSQSDSLGDLLADWWKPEQQPAAITRPWKPEQQPAAITRPPERAPQLPKKPALVSVVCFCICFSCVLVFVL